MITIKNTPTPEGKGLKVALKNLEGKVGRVGWFEKSKYDDKEGTPVAYVAAQNEYGNPQKRIPARPFMRPTIIEKQAEWRKIALDSSKRILKGTSTIADVMELIGLKAAGDIRKKISSIWEPPLSPRTIQARLDRKANKKKVGNLTKPLIHTGIMLGTLTNTVESE